MFKAIKCSTVRNKTIKLNMNSAAQLAIKAKENKKQESKTEDVNSVHSSFAKLFFDDIAIVCAALLIEFYFKKMPIKIIL